MKKIAILGSTGSIGTQTLEIVRENPWIYQVAGLAAGSNGCSDGKADQGIYAEAWLLCGAKRRPGN